MCFRISRQIRRKEKVAHGPYISVQRVRSWLKAIVKSPGQLCPATDLPFSIHEYRLDNLSFVDACIPTTLCSKPFYEPGAFWRSLNMRFAAPFTLLSALLPPVLADIKFTSPAGGETFTGGGSIQVKWTDSGDAPSLSDLSTYQLLLCAGGNEETAIVCFRRVIRRNANQAHCVWF
jgi:hypothetical protein